MRPRFKKAFDHLTFYNIWKLHGAKGIGHVNTSDYNWISMHYQIQTHYHSSGYVFNWYLKCNKENKGQFSSHLWSALLQHPGFSTSQGAIAVAVTLMPRVSSQKHGVQGQSIVTANDCPLHLAVRPGTQVGV